MNWFKSSKERPYILFGIFLTLSAAIYLATCAPVPSRQPSKFKRKQCLECHTEFSKKYFSMKNVHSVVKEKKCEDCHLRHGVIPKLLLKKEGNQICYDCHQKDKIGLNKSRVHSALKTGKCIQCHNPHASQADDLLVADGGDLCFRCHQKQNYQKT